MSIKNIDTEWLSNFYKNVDRIEQVVSQIHNHREIVNFGLRAINELRSDPSKLSRWTDILATNIKATLNDRVLKRQDMISKDICTVARSTTFMLEYLSTAALPWLRAVGSDLSYTDYDDKDIDNTLILGNCTLEYFKEIIKCNGDYLFLSQTNEVFNYNVELLITEVSHTVLCLRAAAAKYKLLQLRA